MSIRLKRYLRIEGITAAKFAQKADLHPSSVSAICSGRLKPYDGQKRKIEKTLLEMGYEGNIEELFEEEV